MVLCKSILAEVGFEALAGKEAFEEAFDVTFKEAFVDSAVDISEGFGVALHATYDDRVEGFVDLSIAAAAVKAATQSPCRFKTSFAACLGSARQVKPGRNRATSFARALRLCPTMRSRSDARAVTRRSLV